MSRPMLAPVALAIGAALAWGAWGFLASRASLVNPIAAWVAVVLVEGVSVLPVLLVVRPSFSWWLVAAGIAGVTGYGLFFLALARTPVAPAPLIAITALYPAVTLAISLLVEHRSPTPRQVVGLALAIVAVILIAG
jgi:transporter family protein